MTVAVNWPAVATASLGVVCLGLAFGGRWLTSDKDRRGYVVLQQDTAGMDEASCGPYCESEGERCPAWRHGECAPKHPSSLRSDDVGRAVDQWANGQSELAQARGTDVVEAAEQLLRGEAQ